jgi:hypothetical protein
MRRLFILSAAAVLALTLLAGCGAKQTATDTTVSSDSLLSSNPVEQPSGSITPTTDLSQPQTPAETPPAETPAATKPAATSSKPKPKPAAGTTAPAKETGVTVAAGTALNISVDTQISSETANVGDTWTGTIKENVIVGDKVVFPAGSIVSGVITESLPAATAKEQGKTAVLGIGITAITVNGTKHAIEAGTEPIVAGSARARNIGAVAVGAGAGALIGRAVGGSGKGALIGGLIGGGAAAAAAAKSKGYQVVIKEGTVVTFNVKAPVNVHS